MLTKSIIGARHHVILAKETNGLCPILAPGQPGAAVNPENQRPRRGFASVFVQIQVQLLPFMPIFDVGDVFKKFDPLRHCARGRRLGTCVVYTNENKQEGNEVFEFLEFLHTLLP